MLVDAATSQTRAIDWRRFALSTGQSLDLDGVYLGGGVALSKASFDYASLQLSYRTSAIFVGKAFALVHPTKTKDHLDAAHEVSLTFLSPPEL